jgi:hypothetical protein
VIDFRYHIVSLISVFLALAVGIALGAGPLKETIGDTLTGQVSSLRAEKEALRAELDGSAVSLSHAETFIDGTAGQLLSGTLTDRRVAVVALGEVSSGVRDAVDGRLQQAGASVSAHVQLTDAWTDPDQRTFRQALAGNLVSYLDPAPATGASVDEELAAALTQALAGADPAAPDRQSESASILLELLSTGDSPLVTVTGSVTAPADAIVVIAPSATQTSDTTATPPADDVQTARLAVVEAADSGTRGAVLLAGARGSDSLVDVLLNDAALRAQVSTVSGMDAVAAQVDVPLALAAQIGGQVGHYGFGDSETVVPPAVTLPPVDRTATAPAAGSGG